MCSSDLAAPLRAKKIRLLIADDNPAMLQRVCTILKNRFDILAAVPDGRDVLSQYATLMPDVIILDISMGRLNGLDVARTLRGKRCKVPIVFLTVHAGDDFVRAALSSGGLGYVVKSHLKSDLAPAIEAAMSGKIFVSSFAS